MNAYKELNNRDTTARSEHREPIELGGVVLHHTAGKWDTDVDWVSRSGAQGGYHCIIAPNGKRAVLAPDRAYTWHAGLSLWQGRDNCNDHMLGVAFSGDTTQHPLTSDQVCSFVEWWFNRAESYGWTLANITDHRTVRENYLNVHPGQATPKVDLDARELDRIINALRDNGQTY